MWWVSIAFAGGMIFVASLITGCGGADRFAGFDPTAPAAPAALQDPGAPAPPALPDADAPDADVAAVPDADAGAPGAEAAPEAASPPSPTFAAVCVLPNGYACATYSNSGGLAERTCYVGVCCSSVLWGLDDAGGANFNGGSACQPLESCVIWYDNNTWAAGVCQ